MIFFFCLISFSFVDATQTEAGSGVLGLAPPLRSPTNTSVSSWKTIGLSKSGMVLNNMKVLFYCSFFSFLFFSFVFFYSLFSFIFVLFCFVLFSPILF